MTSDNQVRAEERGVRPRLLDLFCGAGGCSKGYIDAGFELVGVDIEPQPNYPHEFWRADALEVLGNMPDFPRFDAIHASPPCQAYTSMNRKHEQAETRAAHPSLIAPVRELLEQTGLPYVIENVAGAVKELHNPTQLCGRSLGIELHRHRLFESNVPIMAAPCTGGRDEFGVYGKMDGRRLRTRSDGSEYRAANNLEDAQRAMGIDWMEWDELREAIPPVMTEHIGGYLKAHIEQRIAA